MNETRKLKLAWRLKDKYKVYSIEDLEKEAQLLNAKIADIEARQTIVENRINAWEWQAQNYGDREFFHKEPRNIVISGIGSAPIGGGIAWLFSRDLTTTIGFAAFAFFLGGVGVSIINTHYSMKKPVSRHIARAYSKVLGKKIEKLNMKRLLVDELIDATQNAKQIQQNLANKTQDAEIARQ